MGGLDDLLVNSATRSNLYNTPRRKGLCERMSFMGLKERSCVWVLVYPDIGTERTRSSSGRINHPMANLLGARHQMVCQPTKNELASPVVSCPSLQHNLAV